MPDFDISDTLAPTSDQLDAVDLLGGPRTFTIERVSKGNAEQPVQIHFAEFPRPWRPGKSMRRVLAACWGVQSAEWPTRRVTLFCDPEVRFGGDRVGGTRISHLSHIDGPRDVPLLVTRGRSAMYHVEPLTEAPAPITEPTPEQVASCTDADQLRAWWHEHPSMRAQITARGNELQAASDGALIPPHEGVI